jgi:hypothetical protein
VSGCKGSEEERRRLPARTQGQRCQRGGRLMEADRELILKAPATEVMRRVGWGT